MELDDFFFCGGVDFLPVPADKHNSRVTCRLSIASSVPAVISARGTTDPAHPLAPPSSPLTHCSSLAGPAAAAAAIREAWEW